MPLGVILHYVRKMLILHEPLSLNLEIRRLTEGVDFTRLSGGGGGGSKGEKAALNLRACSNTSGRYIGTARMNL